MSCERVDIEKRLVLSDSFDSSGCRPVMRKVHSERAHAAAREEIGIGQIQRVCVVAVSSLARLRERDEG